VIWFCFISKNEKGIQAKKQIILSNLILRSFDFEQRDDGYSFISTKSYIGAPEKNTDPSHVTGNFII
jgi:hypothetical protein